MSSELLQAPQVLPPDQYFEKLSSEVNGEDNVKGTQKRFGREHTTEAERHFHFVQSGGKYWFDSQYTLAN